MDMDDMRFAVKEMKADAKDPDRLRGSLLSTAVQGLAMQNFERLKNKKY